MVKCFIYMCNDSYNQANKHVHHLVSLCVMKTLKICLGL